MRCAGGYTKRFNKGHHATRVEIGVRFSYRLQILKLKQMEYQPIQEDEKQDWINWLEEQMKELDGKQQAEVTRLLLNTEEGDLANMKDLVGRLLATLKQQPVTIN